VKGNKYVEIDREMSKAFRAYDDLAVPTVSEFEGQVSQLPMVVADIPAEYSLVPGKYSSVREEYLKEITIRLEAANRRRERKMGGRK
jgi:hypothetical protein